MIQRGEEIVEFICVGFDIRDWPCEGELSVEEGEWNINEKINLDVIKLFNLKENEYQLLEIGSMTMLQKIINYISKYEACNLLAIELPKEVVSFHNKKHGYQRVSNDVDLSGLVSRGYDVCDYNGFYTFMRHPETGDYFTNLIPEDDICKALEVAQLANVVEKQHSPFVVAKLFTFR